MLRSGDRSEGGRGKQDLEEIENTSFKGNNFSCSTDLGGGGGKGDGGEGFGLHSGQRGERHTLVAENTSNLLFSCAALLN